jgi:hypothetical protein
MPCNNCGSSTPVYSYGMGFLSSSNCSDCTSSCTGGCLNTGCVFYTGSSLTCSGIDTDDTLETAIQKIDEKLCSVAGVYGAYAFSCLDNDTAITTEQQFVETISDYVCTLRTDVDQFIDVTFVGYQGQVDTRFDNIEQPELICATAGVTDTDSLEDILSKYCTKLGAISTAIDITSVDWDQCVTVNPDPTTIAEGFSVLIDQICDIRTTALAAAVLPTFNNTTSCLASPGASDTLAATIDKIKDRLCLTPTLDNDNLTSDCVEIPATDTDLEAILQNILDKLDNLSAVSPTFDAGDFVVEAIDEDNACAGMNISLATPIDQDRFVAVDEDDETPGTLVDKLTAGDNIELDSTTTPGTIIINASLTDTNDKVKASAGDPNPAGFLNTKINGTSFEGISIIATANNITGKVDLNPDINWGTFVRAMITAVNADPDLKAEVCAFIASCGCNCGDDCTNYSIENESGDTINAQYYSCNENEQITIGIPDGSTVEVCARTGTLVATGATVTNLGDCGGGTTSTTTTSTTTATPLCKHYAIENLSGSAGTYSYIDCNGDPVTAVAIENSEVQQLCAQEGSIAADSPLVLNTIFTADCTGGTTTTTTTVAP